MIVLGLDLGDRHIGVALLDSSVPIVIPLPALHNNRFFLKELAKLSATHQLAKIIIGLPLSLSGVDTPQTRKVRLQSQKIEAVINLPVIFQDERFTTHQASTMLKTMGSKPAHHLDSVSAQLILETWWQGQNG